MRPPFAHLVLSLGLIAAPAWSGTTYQLQDLGLAPGYTQSFSYAVSDSGSFVAGWVQAGSNTRAFRWSAAAGMELLPLEAGATASRAFGVNDSGVVAGESVLSATRRGATLWAADGSATLLGTLPNPASANFSSVAFAVNNAGTAAGWSDSVDSTRAYRWTAAAGMASLGTLAGGSQTRAYAISADDSVVGWGTSAAGDRGFLAGAGLSSVGALTTAAGSRTRAFGASNNGWVAGDASDPALGSVAFVWSVSSGLLSLGKLPGAASSFGADINSAATAVGWNEGGANGEAGFVWTAQDGMQSFNSLLVDAAGWQVQRARAINDLGLVVANAVGSDGQVHAVLLIPVPEPAAWALLLAGLLGTGLVSKCQRSNRAVLNRDAG